MVLYWRRWQAAERAAASAARRAGAAEAKLAAAPLGCLAIAPTGATGPSEASAYPKAALFGFCLALVTYHMFAVVLAALRDVHGESTVKHEVSLYSL